MLIRNQENAGNGGTPGQRTPMSAYVTLHTERGGSLNEWKEQKNGR